MSQEGEMRRTGAERVLMVAAALAVQVCLCCHGAATPISDLFIGPARPADAEADNWRDIPSRSEQSPGDAEFPEALPIGPAKGSAAISPASVPDEQSGADRGQNMSFGLVDSLRTLAALALVLGLAVAAAAGLKKIAKGRGGLLGALGPGGPSPSGLMEILGRYPVGAGQTLVLLRLDRRVLLLHQTTSRKGASMRTLAEVADADEVASILMKTREDETERVETGFREAMRRLETDFTSYESAFEPEPQPRMTPAVALDASAPGSIRSRLARWTGPTGVGAGVGTGAGRVAGDALGEGA